MMSAKDQGNVLDDMHVSIAGRAIELDERMKRMVLAAIGAGIRSREFECGIVEIRFRGWRGKVYAKLRPDIPILEEGPPRVTDRR